MQSMSQSHKDGSTNAAACPQMFVRINGDLASHCGSSVWKSNYSWAITHDALHSEDTSGPTLHPVELNHSPH